MARLLQIGKLGQTGVYCSGLSLDTAPSDEFDHKTPDFGRKSLEKMWKIAPKRKS
jgi:hypothetical protein